MRMRHAVALTVALCSTFLTCLPALAQFSQQGPKLVGTGAAPNSKQGWSVSLSADGNTAIVGGSAFNPVPIGIGGLGGAGAAWVFTRSGGLWTQQSQLIGSGASADAVQGFSVSISADGNTAIVGGPGDNLKEGAAWVWTRSGGVWTQQGNKLVGSGAVGAFPAQQGWSVSLSDDGNTAIVGGIGDNNFAGAAWVWTRSAGVWTQQSNKLVSASASGAAQQGASVALSADGNTAIIGGVSDSSDTGAAWVWTRSAGVWTEQSNKLVGSGATPFARQGSSVSLSADGNTAIVGSISDAAWVWTRSGGVWTQQGSKLAGAGFSVSLSNDGNTAIVGSPSDSGQSGAAWVWKRSVGVWTQQPNKLVGSGATGSAQQGYSVSLSGDSNTAILGGPSDASDTGAAWVFFADPALIPTASPWTLVALIAMLALLGALKTRV